MLNDVNKNSNIQNIFRPDNSNYKLTEKSVLLNVDSSWREKQPKNILQGLNIMVTNLILVKDSNILKINFNNTNLIKSGDKIIIKNIKARSEIISQALYFIQNYEYALINIPNHGFTIDFNKYYSPNKIEISTIDYDDAKISNIPINSLITKHQIYLIEQLNLPQEFIDNIDITYDELKTNFIAIKLLFPYISYNIYDVIPNLTEINFTEIAGIPTGYFNADFPVSFNQRQGNYLVNTNSSKWIEVILPFKSYKDNIIRGNILIDKIISEYEGYPEISNYTLKLPKHLTNISKIELVSTEIPSNFNNISSSNNLLYWQNLDDGKTIYNVKVPEGNYSIHSLIQKLTELINSTPRKTNTTIIPNNFFEITVNTSSQEIIFKSFREDYLSNAISIDKIIVEGKERNVLEIIHNDNNVDVGDIITISNSTAISYIPAEIINRKHQVINVNKTNNSYQVILPTFNQTEIRGSIGNDNVGLDIRSAYTSSGAGGEEIKIITKSFSRLLFNKSNTLGTILGFRDVELPNAITEFKSELSNKDNYANEDGFNLNVVGNSRNDNRLFNFTSDVRYLLLYINDYEEIITNTNASNCFAKIQVDNKNSYKLEGNNLNYMINTFVSYPIIFTKPIPNLSQLQIKLTYPDGSLVNFGNIEHSFTLKITENIFINNPI
ncbi:hypothetical protein crov326 [Cafeteria roenbergensis virus]|uniref:Uncharacterized protein n=1 Tax=Cafeteria roenbergensis virus (strain BV-PW1) TaxID=693272 RepID=E3T597_CROVB|nr:hypothetical protein crov326 [Cafeteria roenbergensis virus BV-PW1]ADO67360.1 hypothetical protein crov326 [Cafeteria roenbergensis virus BV-PW1]